MMTRKFQKPLTLAEAAAAFGCSLDTVRRWAREGRIETYRIPGGVRIRPEEVERVLAGGSVGGRA